MRKREEGNKGIPKRIRSRIEKLIENRNKRNSEEGNG